MYDWLESVGFIILKLYQSEKACKEQSMGFSKQKKQKKQKGHSRTVKTNHFVLFSSK